ncbi:hypothetical protein E1211_25920 [Micromonospora sp. 15K316]|uniref:hypothetical protein n=1 Tax=Micromonospora sp. 15K316 TaxID=2530376 RepID=UPI00105349AD|nr:hypothetical protein [Micromonospora sp. 15K316]TDC29499.1 hypothetical protein E1211_25920 [Micromonospora sp. 15K316]
MLNEYLLLEATEIFNGARLEAYLDSVGSPLDTHGLCGCPTLTAEVLGDAPYTTPAEDNAPWYDPDVPESADFAGLMVLSIDGLDDHPVTRQVTTAVAGGAALGPARVQPRTIVVTALLLGASCCAVDYGLRWLAQALSGCTGESCGGDCLTLYNCCPPEGATAAEFERHRRTLRRVALVDGPTVVARNGDGCTSGTCSVGSDILTVEFTLVAATPWMWTDPVPVLEMPVPSDDNTGCVQWCVHDGDGECGTCRLAGCADPTAACGSPSCRVPAPPQPPAPTTCFCKSLAVNSVGYDLDLSDWPRWFGAAPIIDVSAGSADLHRVTVTLFERTQEHDGLSCEEMAELERCNPHSVYEVAFVPAGGTVTLDGQVGRALVECGGRCERSRDVYGRDGGPLAFPLLDCAEYCVIVEADAIMPVAEDATVTVSLSGRGY